MTEEDLRAAGRHLLWAAMELAPTGKKQTAMAALARETPNSKAKVLALLDAMTDGVRYGNWPA